MFAFASATRRSSPALPLLAVSPGRDLPHHAELPPAGADS